jgi:hypothetical protein
MSKVDVDEFDLDISMVWFSLDDSFDAGSVSKLRIRFTRVFN